MLKLICYCSLLVLLSSCTTQTQVGSHNGRVVRTTAYCVKEKGGGGKLNAIGKKLSVHSAASDWSFLPLGTRFKLDNGEEFEIDDYGTALLGTSTIDLFKSSHSKMTSWGVRSVHISILKWGSFENSIAVLSARAKHRVPRLMAAAIRKSCTSL